MRRRKRRRRCERKTIWWWWKSWFVEVEVTAMSMGKLHSLITS